MQKVKDIVVTAFIVFIFTECIYIHSNPKEFGTWLGIVESHKQQMLFNIECDCTEELK